MKEHTAMVKISSFKERLYRELFAICESTMKHLILLFLNAGQLEHVVCFSACSCFCNSCYAKHAYICLLTLWNICPFHSQRCGCFDIIIICIAGIGRTLGNEPVLNTLGKKIVTPWHEVPSWRLFIFYLLVSSKGRLVWQDLCLFYVLYATFCLIYIFGKLVMTFSDIGEIGCMSILKCHWMVIVENLVKQT